MSMKRKWLKGLFLMMMAGASFARARMDPKEIEDLLHIMNETKVEFTIPDGSDGSDKKWPSIEIAPTPSVESGIAKGETTSADDS
jgi:hypothetical protein